MYFQVYFISEVLAINFHCVGLRTSANNQCQRSNKEATDRLDFYFRIFFLSLLQVEIEIDPRLSMIN